MASYYQNSTKRRYGAQNAVDGNLARKLDRRELERQLDRGRPSAAAASAARTNSASETGCPASAASAA